MPTLPMTVVHRLAAPPVRRLLRPTVHGRDHIPAHGGALLAANHVSNLDNYLLSCVSPRPVWFLGKRELARGLVGRWNVAMGMVPVARGAGDTASLDRLVELLRAGELVAVFPEGTRSPTGALFRFRSGVARIAHAGAVPVVPVGLRGTATVWPRGRAPVPRRPDAGAVAVHVGSALDPPASADARTRRGWTGRLRERVAELSGQDRDDRFAPMAGDR